MGGGGRGGGADEVTTVLAGGVEMPQGRVGVVVGGARVGVVGASSITMSEMERKQSTSFKNIFFN